MKNQDKGKQINMFFSAFLIIAYVICAYFFSDFAAAMASPLSGIVSVLVFAVFGLLLFYATRVGDGKPVVRFSLITLIVLVLPALYIIIAGFAAGLPFHNEIVSSQTVTTLASIALGYGIPYTFLSGFELVPEEEAEEAEAQDSEENAENAENEENEENAESDDSTEENSEEAENSETKETEESSESSDEE